MKNSFFLSNDSEKEQVLQVLNKVQTRAISIKPWCKEMEGEIRLLSEEGDWLVLLQWLQDKGFVQINPVRPPFMAFERWLRENEVTVFHIPYSAYRMSLAHRLVDGARYPWTTFKRQGYMGMIKRWCFLYEDLSRLMAK